MGNLAKYTDDLYGSTRALMSQPGALNTQRIPNWSPGQGFGTTSSMPSGGGYGASANYADEIFDSSKRLMSQPGTGAAKGASRMGTRGIGRMAKKLAPLGVVGGLALEGYDAVTNSSSVEEGTGRFGGAVTGGAAGAAIGSFLGPIGTLVGGGIGSMLGGDMGASGGRWWDDQYLSEYEKFQASKPLLYREIHTDSLKNMAEAGRVDLYE